MNKQEFINKLRENTMAPLTGTDVDDRILHKKIESMTILNLINNPRLILGNDEYKDCDYSEVAELSIKKHFYYLLIKSPLFIEFMEVFRNKYCQIFTFCQLEKLLMILGEIYSKSNDEKEQYRIVDLIEHVTNIMTDAEEQLDDLIDDHPLEYLKNSPNLFFRYVFDCLTPDSVHYTFWPDLICNDEFVDVVENLINSGYDFGEIEVEFLERILEVSRAFYEYYVYGDTPQIDEQSLNILSEEIEIDDVNNFDLEHCDKVLEQIKDLHKHTGYISIQSNDQNEIEDLPLEMMSDALWVISQDLRNKASQNDDYKNQEHDPIKYFINKPHAFMGFLKDMDREEYYKLLLNNAFVNVIANLVDKNFDFTKEEIELIQKIIWASMELYEVIVMGNPHFYEGEEAILFEELENEYSGRKAVKFDYEMAELLYDELTDLLNNDDIKKMKL